jgi:hypothetical protein
MTVISYPTDPKVLHRILTHLGLPTCAPTTAPARSVDLDAPQLDFEDPGDTEQPTRPSPPAARSPPLPDWQVDADAPVGVSIAPETTPPGQLVS